MVALLNSLQLVALMIVNQYSHLPQKGNSNKETWHSTEGNKNPPGIILKIGYWKNDISFIYKDQGKRWRNQNWIVNRPESDLDHSSQYHEELPPMPVPQRQYFPPII